MGRTVAFAAAVFLGIAAMAASGGEALVGGPWGELIEPAWSGNLLGNPGFEEGERGWKGVPWKTWVELDQAAARSGERSVRFRDTSSAPWYRAVSFSARDFLASIGCMLVVRKPMNPEGKLVVSVEGQGSPNKS